MIDFASLTDFNSLIDFDSLTDFKSLTGFRSFTVFKSFTGLLCSSFAVFSGFSGRFSDLFSLLSLSGVLGADDVAFVVGVGVIDDLGGVAAGEDAAEGGNGEGNTFSSAFDADSCILLDNLAEERLVPLICTLELPEIWRCRDPPPMAVIDDVLG